MMSRTNCWRIALASLIVASVVGEARAETVYAENFTGSSATNLTGTMPTISTTGASWAGGTLIKGDGSVSNSQTSSWLPLSVASGYIYTVTTTITTTYETYDCWLAAGFSSGSGSGSFLNGGTESSWALLKPTGTIQYFATFSTPSTTLIGATSVTSGATTKFTIVLNTINSLWTTSLYINDSLYKSYTYTTNPTINYVGLGTSGGAYGSFASFSVTQTVPEPTSTALIVTGAGGLLAYAWRKRRKQRIVGGV